MSTARVLSTIAFGFFLVFWAIGAVWMAASGVRPFAGTLFCGTPLLLGAAVVWLVFRLTSRPG